MHVMLSVPRPSEAAKFMGHIFSSIISTIFESTTLFEAGDFPTGDPAVIVVECEADEAEFYFCIPRAEVDVPPSFLTGETTPLRTPAVPPIVVAAFACLKVLGPSARFYNLLRVSYTKSTAC